MTQTTNTEFWRDLKPIEKVFQPDALPEAYIANAATDDERYYVPLQRDRRLPAAVDLARPEQWCDILTVDGAGLVNRHYHPHEVFAYTISGKWGYLEHDWIATAGDFIYETPGEGHTLVAYESDEPMTVLFIVKGPLIWLDEKGEPSAIFDVHRLHRHLQGALREGRPRGRLHRHAVPLGAGAT